jgi:haloacetate dehalogenase
LFEGFELSFVDTGEATIRVRHGGSGPPLLLLHGHPQTHAMWNFVAPGLAEDFTVVAADLRGYGESSKPPTTSDHEPYSGLSASASPVTTGAVGAPTAWRSTTRSGSSG